MIPGHLEHRKTLVACFRSVASRRNASLRASLRGIGSGKRPARAAPLLGRLRRPTFAGSETCGILTQCAPRVIEEGGADRTLF